VEKCFCVTVPVPIFLPTLPKHSSSYAFSPDHVSLDFHLFGPLRDALRDHCLGSDDELKGTIHMWLAIQFVQCWIRWGDHLESYVPVSYVMLCSF
jgi:hypothetical protein